ncbi:MAG: thioredoxin family protein [Fimbriimonas sp.]
MKACFTALIALCLFGSALVARAQVSAEASEKAHAKFDPKRDAAKDIADAVVLAKKQNKRIILDVGGEWCGWCKKLDKFFETDMESAEILKKKFIVVKVNYSQENENKTVLSKYPEIKGYPHLFVLDKNGKLLHSQDTGLLETGDHHDHDKVLAFLTKWSG